SHGERRRVSADVKNALENDTEWTFDILQLEKVTENHALVQLGIKIFERWKVADSLSCNEDILHRWLFTVEAHYHAGNAYHNATHAADVLQMNVVDVPEEAREDNSLTICNMLVKCADISNPTREWALCEKWAYRIVEEYFDQTREEREKGLPVTMEVFDRKTCNVPLTQCGFI
ncbi:hypothetical protein TELCIR_17532, partial [Teladorsagia circumcincta]